MTRAERTTGESPYRPYVHAVLILLALAGSAVRVREAFVHSPLDHIFSDPARHWDHAVAPLGNDPLTVIDPPLYQMWLSLAAKWSLGMPQLVSAYAAAMSVVTPWLWYRFLRVYLRSRGVALSGWALLAWLPSWIGIFSYFMTETLLLPLMGASLWQTVRASRHRTVSSFCGMVVLWTLTGLSRAIGVPLGGVAGILVWIRHPRKLRTLAYSCLIVLAILGPFAVRNHHQINLWSPLGTGWQNKIYVESGKRAVDEDILRDGKHWYYTFQSPATNQPPLMPLQLWATKRTGTARVAIDVSKGAADWESESKRTAVHGAELWRVRWENVVFLLFGPTWPDNDSAYTIAVVTMRMRWVWAPLFVIALVVAAVRFRFTLSRPLLPALIVVWFLCQGVMLVAINEGRYRKPAEGLLVAQVLVWCDAMLERRRARQRRFAVETSDVALRRAG